MTYTYIHVCTHTRIHTCVYVYIFVRFHPLCYEPRTRARYFYFGAERPAPRAPRRMQAPSNANCRRGHLVSLPCPSQMGHRQTSSVRAFQPGLFFCASSHGSHLPWITGLQTWRKWNKRAHSFKFTWVCLALFPILPFYPVFFFPPEVDKREPTCYLIIFENSILVNAYLLHYEHTN